MIIFFKRKSAQTLSGLGFFLLFILALNCKDTNQPVEPIRYEAAPRVEPGKIKWDGPADSYAIRDQNVEEITKLLNRLVEIIEREELDKLPGLISKKRGLWVDLKAHKSYKEILKMVQEDKGFLQTFYLDTENLRQVTDNPEHIAVRDVLHYTKTLRASFYFEEGGRECEVKLQLVENPDFNYHLNHPVFIKEGKDWKILRLF